MACCNDCGRSGGLGQLDEPRALTPEEIRLFLIYHQDDIDLQNYLRTGSPEWGIIVHDRGREFLVYSRVWKGGELHIIDVTGTSLSEEVKKAPYHSPDDVGFFGNLLNRIDEVAGGSMDFMTTAAWILTIYALYGVWKDIKA